MVFKDAHLLNGVNKALIPGNLTSCVNCLAVPDVSLRYYWASFPAPAFARQVDNGSVLIPSV
ncbi:hypothetical protein BN77_3028 [Rhizobium mesoamericanum STM3625]|uniref:Uncharacterized protein n=1 Tax=Rhizobium mesoamericanum STM3625 TaxID=1211777 RepID=K0PPP4_9HYPH|nr:hypothetical protein BN77_3028 [Rhizobium mesoamericanum STM3625]